MRKGNEKIPTGSHLKQKNSLFILVHKPRSLLFILKNLGFPTTLLITKKKNFEQATLNIWV